MAMNIRETERALISVLLADACYQEQILNECHPEMFTDADCKRILLIAQRMMAASMPIDLATLSAQCETAFAPKLVEISQTHQVPSFTEQYITVIKKAWRFRTLQQRLRECEEKALKHDESCLADIEEMREVYLDMGQEEEKHISSVCKEAADSFFEKEQGVSSGFAYLDTILGGGLIPGRLMVLGGRPGMGKSALALNMAVKAAGKGAVVLYISLEMTVKELTKRALGMLSGVDPYQAQQEKEKAMERIEEAGKTLAPRKLYFRDGGDSSLSSVLGAARRVRAKEGRLDLIVIDYVGLMRTERTKTSTRQQEIAEISRGLKRFAVRMPTCILLLSQLNREADNRIPHLSDLRESGDLEQDADVVLFPVRGCSQEGAAPTDESASLYIAKNRTGKPGKIELQWLGGTYTFREKDIPREKGKAGQKAANG